MSTRVAFRFPNGEEIRYPDRIPERGDRIQSTGGEAFLVSHVEQMKQEMEDLIVLEKDRLTGDTIVVSGATRAAPSGAFRPLGTR